MIINCKWKWCKRNRSCNIYGFSETSWSDRKKYSVRIVGLRAEICAQNLQNRKHHIAVFGRPESVERPAWFKFIHLHLKHFCSMLGSRHLSVVCMRRDQLFLLHQTEQLIWNVYITRIDSGVKIMYQLCDETRTERQWKVAISEPKVAVFETLCDIFLRGARHFHHFNEMRFLVLSLKGIS
jgi:hypothetical protein